MAIVSLGRGKRIVQILVKLNQSTTEDAKAEGKSESGKSFGEGLFADGGESFLASWGRLRRS